MDKTLTRYLQKNCPLKSTDNVNKSKMAKALNLLGYYYRICTFARVGVTSTNLLFGSICDIF